MLQNEMIEKIVRTLDSKRAEDIQAIEIKVRLYLLLQLFQFKLLVKYFLLVIVYF